MVSFFRIFEYELDAESTGFTIVRMWVFFLVSYTYSIKTWKHVTRNMLDMYQINHISMYLKYDVLGISPLMDPINDTRTRRIVTLILVLFAISSGPRKSVM